MKKLFYYLAIRMTTRQAETAIKVYEKIYNTPVQHSEPEKPIPVVVSQKPTNVGSVPNVGTNKNDLIDSLNYLKSKKVKTKQDKDSIYTLEMVLKNM